jgi:hypothetical protein
MGVTAVKEAVKTLLSDKSMSQVTKWFGAEPAPTFYPSNCFGWVEWNGGAKTDESMDGLKKAVDEFYVVIVTKHIDADVAETSGLTLLEAAEVLLEADRTFSGTVSDSHVSLREKQKEFDGKFSVNAVRLTLHTWRWL